MLPLSLLPLGFLEEYFINPIQYGTGYNIVNTITYAILLIAALFLVKKALERLDIEMDRRLWIDLIPFVLLGGVVRALEDAAYLPHHWIFITPVIYFLIFAVAFSCILTEKYSRKPVTQWIGIFLLAAFGVQALVLGQNWTAFLATLGLVAIIFLGVDYALKFLKSKLLHGRNWHVLIGHILDSTASVMAVSFLCVGGVAYTEQHVLPSAIFGILPVVAFIPIKIAVILAVLYVIDKEVEGNWNWLLKFTVFTLGMAPGVRNLMTALINSTWC